MLDFIHEISQTLRNNRTRTMLTGISVAWGIFMLILLVSIGRGVVNGFNGRATLSNTASIYPGRTSQAHNGYPVGRVIELVPEDVELLLKDENVPVDEVTAEFYDWGSKISSNIDYITGMCGVYPGFLKDYKLNIISGRSINDYDVKLNRKVIILSEKNAARLFGSKEKALGQTVSAMDLSWKVVGIYSHDWRRDSYVPASTLMTVKAGKPHLDKLAVTLKDAKNEEDAKNATEAIRTSLAVAHNFSTNDKSAIYIWDKLTSYLEGRKAMSILQTALWLIGLLSLVSGIVGVSNIMFVSVRERTHEIGIRRAIGAKPRNILWQVVMESVSITTLFGYIGIVLGMAVMQLVSHLIEGTAAGEAIENPTVDLSMAFEVTLVLIAAGALAGMFPALKALKVKPVEALRDE